MASLGSRKYQFMFSKVPMLTYIQGSVLIGSSGAVTSITGNGVAGVTRLTTGIYQIQLTENYNAFMSGNFQLESGVTGSPVADGSFVANTLYQITVVGTTNWSSVGLASGLTAAVGQQFVATGIGGAGTGTATAVGKTGLSKVEIAQNPQVMLQTNLQNNLGAILIMQTFNYSEALANPTSGARIRFELMLRQSSNQY